MDVRCSRCGTEYDFDDALVSERGTTVKCTNCGHQFKVFPGGAGGVPERWIVRKSSGRELVYTSLRDLQRAIAQRQVGPQDLLSRGGGQPLRALAAIAELEPFFSAQGPAKVPNEQAQRTLLGMSPSAGAPLNEDTVRENPAFPEGAPPSVTRRATATPGAGPRQPSPPARALAAEPVPYARLEDLEPKTVPRNPLPDPATEPEAATLDSGRLGNGRSAAVIAEMEPQNDGMRAAFRAAQESFSDEPLPGLGGPPRKSALRWVVGLVLVGAVAFVGGTVGMRYLKQLRAVPSAPAAPEDSRVRKLLAQGDADLSRGDFESAKEHLDKASVLAERDPAVLTALARLEATRADQHWLLLKVLDPASKVDREATLAELTRRLPRVKKASDDAAAVAPNDGAAVRGRIDALRLAGDTSHARDLVASLGDVTSQPETAYVLAALDMAEAEPAWPTIIDRLRTAAAAERGPGRARAALVYALASAGHAEDAKTEIGKLDVDAPNPLARALLAFVDRKSAVPAASASASASASAAAVRPLSSPVAATVAPGSPAGEPRPAGTDFRKLLEDASAAKRGGDFARAEVLYRAAQEQSPGNVEATAGLGDVAKAQGDSAAAARYYETVLQQNPTYLPTLISLADIKWSGGDHPGALTLYKRVVNQADPSSTYGQRAAARLAEAQGASAGSTPPASPSATPTAPPKPTTQAPARPPAEDLPGNVDTSDLPGFK